MVFSNKSFFPIALLFCFLFSTPVWGRTFNVGLILSSPLVKLEAPPGVILQESNSGSTTFLVPEDQHYPFNLTATDPFGITFVYKISHPKKMRFIDARGVVIKDKRANPPSIPNFPALCPWVTRNNDEVVYHGELDLLNHRPTFQFIDPDSQTGQQSKLLKMMDDKNVLTLKKVSLHYDYEDTQILDYQGPNPLTGKPQTIYEGEGGFYANIHYAIIPFKNHLDNLDRQTMLHLAQGKLSEINREDLRPLLRTHSFIPGPFVTYDATLYQMCEWGDTSHIAPVQEMNYENIYLWDWDFNVAPKDKILLVVWEGDEEDWLYQEKILDPFVLTDDIIGVFEIRKKDTFKPLLLRNKAGDFEITVQTIRP